MSIAPIAKPDPWCDHRWHVESIANVQQRIATVALDEEEPLSPTLGIISLHPHQQDAVARIKRAITQFGGALLADEPGLGKTFAALALARDYDCVTLLAPAAILEMWRSAIRTAQVSNVVLISIHGLSRKPRAVGFADSKRELKSAAARTLVVIDEAHYLRTRTTQRYARAAELCAGRDVLLLSATPLHNRPTELRSLLALFMGNRADVLQRDTLEALIVRRTHQDIASAHLPAVVQHSPLSIPDNPPVLEALLTLPPPLPARDGQGAGALVRLGLLRAWCSSDAALTATLRRRRMRGESLLHALAHGRYPTRSELRTWTTGTDSIQLGFPELLVSNAHSEPGTPLEQMLVAVTAHLTALELVERTHLKSAVGDTHRSALLRMMLNETPHTPILAFSQFASTINALFRALSDVAGIAALTSQGGRVAGGPIARQDLISRFAPRAHERPPPPAHEAIRLLLTTDMLSEGVNLQDAGRLVHLDQPWTEAARAQRVGRLARIGSPHKHIDVYSIAPPPGVDRTLQIVATLARKAGLTRQFIGRNSLDIHASSVNQLARDAAMTVEITASAGAHFGATDSVAIKTSDRASTSAPDSATLLREVFKWWNSPRHGAGADNECVATCDQTICATTDTTNFSASNTTHSAAVAVAPATQHGWIAAIDDGQTLRVWAAVESTFHSDSAGVLSAIECIRNHSGSSTVVQGRLSTNVALTQDDARVVVTALAEIHSRLTDAAITQLNGPTADEISDVRRAVLEHITRLIAASASARRSILLSQAQQAERAVQRARGIGSEQRLAHWLALTRMLDPIAWLNHWRSDAQLATQTDAATGPAGRSVDADAQQSRLPSEARVLAVLVLQRTS